MNTIIFHTMNAGVYLSSGRTKLLVDGVHTGKEEGMSLMPEKLKSALEQGTGIFDHLNGLLFTHLHADHYWADGVRIVLQHSPKTSLFGPGLKGRYLSGYEETAGKTRFSVGDFQICAYTTIHSGEIYKEDPHRSLLLGNIQEKETIFIAGDAVFEPALADQIRQETALMTGKARVTAAFVNVYQLLEDPSVDFLKALNPERLLLYHWPEKEDDRDNYLPMIRSALRYGHLPGRKIELQGHMSYVSDSSGLI